MLRSFLKLCPHGAETEIPDTPSVLLPVEHRLGPVGVEPCPSLLRGLGRCAGRWGGLRGIPFKEEGTPA